jgi:predicted O-methyltransferase YrrM
MKDYKQIVDEIPDVVIFERPEMVELLTKVSEINPKVILEVGTNQGKSAMAFIKAFDPELFITMDIAPRNMYQGIEMPGENYHYLWEHDSMKTETANEVADILYKARQGDTYRKVDFLWIDGSHYPENVKSDYMKYKQLVRPGGIVGFHDIFCTSQEDIFVNPFWNEIKKNFKYFEYQMDPKDIHLAFPTGIGLLYI